VTSLDSARIAATVQRAGRRRRGGSARRLPALAAAVAVFLATALGGFGFGVPTAAADTSFSFVGGGWGHGVGMSQYGACALAAGGSDAPSILGWYYRGTALTTVSEATDLRVLLAVGSTFTLVTGGTTSIAGVGTVGAGATITVTRSGSNIVLRGAVNATKASEISVNPSGSALRVTPPGSRFNRGVLRIGLNGGGGLRAVMGGMSTNDYLRGLGEVPSSWPAEALKAQAIAGRTIAQGKATRAGRWSSDYDLSAAIDGAYIGYEKEFGALGSAWVAAVNATNGRVITYNGALISAVYSSSSGGYTENSEVVWVSALPYLRGVPDPSDGGCNNGRNRWTTTFSGTELGKRLGMGPVVSRTTSGAAGVSGRVDKVTFTFTDTSGTRRSFTGAQLRSTLGLYSTKFVVQPTARPPTGALTDLRAYNRRNLLVAGRASDPDGAPRVFIASVLNGRTTWRTVQSVNGYFMDVWPVGTGKHTTCVAVLDTPTGAATQLGCRDTVIK